MITPIALIPGQALPASVAILGSAASVKTTVGRFVLVNTGASAGQVTLYRVKGAGAPAVTDQIIPAQTVAAQSGSSGTKIVTEMEGLVLESGDTIQGFASVTTINVQASGYQST